MIFVLRRTVELSRRSVAPALFFSAKSVTRDSVGFSELLYIPSSFFPNHAIRRKVFTRRTIPIANNAKPTTPIKTKATVSPKNVTDSTPGIAGNS